MTIAVGEKGKKMPRYIDRDIALSHPFANGQYDKENANEHFIFGYEGYKEWLEQLPTVDAVEVVRCKECIHRCTEDGLCEGRGWPMQLVPDDGFCDKGERRKE